MLANISMPISIALYKSFIDILPMSYLLSCGISVELHTT